MKKLLVFSIFVVSFIFVNAQKIDTLKFTSAEVCSGKGAVTSGLYSYASFENKKYSFMVTLSNQDNEVTFLRKLFREMLVGANAGYFFNVPYVGPQIIFSPFKFLTTFHWLGYALGAPGENVNAPIFLFNVQQVNFNFYKFTAAYTLIHYMDNLPQNVASFKYTGKINRNFSCYSEVGYDFTKNDQLLKLGIVYKK